MSTLVAKKYRTPLFLKLADHTYVECGTGARGWSCWGGKTGGTEFHRGIGSTAQANAIAEPDERAGITCYLINGVCHQAANRILLPAGILVVGARGYEVSEALYGPYGRPRGFLGFCNAPFDKHEQVTGDLSECEEPESYEETLSDPKDIQYIERVTSLYSQQSVEMLAEGPDLDPKQLQTEIEVFQSALFSLMMDFRLGPEFADTDNAASMLEHRTNVEANRFEIEQSFADGEINVDAFVGYINSEVIGFQTAAANTLSEKDYQALLGLPRDEQVTLGDTQIARQAFAGLDQRR
jgi:hypothetical protein